jgi:predicted SAM-dependent methyltransferase
MENNLIKLNLGCGSSVLEGYINCDLYNEDADMKFDAKCLPFDNNSVDEIFASHLIEHFDFFEGQSVLKEWYKKLKIGGRLVVETPDFLNSCKRFIEADENLRIKLYGHFFCWPWVPGQTHKFLYTETQLKWTLNNMGFKNIKRVNPMSVYLIKGLEDIHLRMVAEK